MGRSASSRRRLAALGRLAVGVGFALAVTTAAGGTVTASVGSPSAALHPAHRRRPRPHRSRHDKKGHPAKHAKKTTKVLSPVIRSFSAKPSFLTARGGTVNLLGHLARTSVCVISSTPPLAGLPKRQSCSGGTERLRVQVLANASSSLRRIVFHLKAINKTKSSLRNSLVRERAAPPTAGALVADPSSLASTGGTVTLSDTISRASSCEFSSSPGLTGLPKSEACRSGAVSLTLSIPAGASATAYDFTLVVHGPGGTISRQATARRQAAPAPSVGAVSASPGSLAYAGGTVSLSATVANASSCAYSVSPAIPGFSGATPCSGGSADLSVAIPANDTSTTLNYVFSLAANGPGGSATSSAPAEVSEAAAPPPTVGPVGVSAASLPATGGTESLSTTVANATTCTYSVSPPITGFSGSVPCSSGTASLSAPIPANSADSPVTYTFSLSAAGPGGTASSPSSATVTEAAAPPSAGTVQASTTSVGAGGGSVSLSTAVTNASSCTYSVSPSLSGFPQSVPCSTGTATVTATIPANTASSPVSYTFSLSASGPGGSTTSSGPATVTEAPSFPLTFSAAPAVEPPLVQYSTISCPSSSFCAAGDSNAGNVVIYDNSAWGAPDQLSTSKGIQALACASSSLCVASDGTDLWSYDGTSWQRGASPFSGGAPITDIACASGPFCMVADGSGTVYTTTDGSSWTSQASFPGGAYGLSCPSPSSCLALLGTQNSSFALYSWSPTGGWTSGASLSTAGEPSDFSCASSSLCVADVYDPMTTETSTYVYSGTSWAALSPTGAQLYDLSCAANGQCYGTGGAQSMPPELYAYSAGSWSAVSSSGNAPSGSISCVSASFCMSVNGATATSFDGVKWTGSNIGWTAQVTGIACPSGSFCMAVDNSGNYTTYNGTSWTTPSQLLSSVGLSSVSCTSSSFCVALGSSASHLYTWHGTSWTSSSVSLSSYQQGAVSCTATGSGAFCAAVAGENASVYNGTSWSTPAAIDPTNKNLTGVSCPTASYCVAVDSYGATMTYSSGTGWTAPTTIDPNASSYPGGGTEFVSCLAAGTCVVTGWDGYAEILQNGSWSSPSSLAGGSSLGGVSCNASANYCVVASFGSLYYVQEQSGSYELNPYPESAGPTGAQGAWEAASCWSSGCMLVSSANTSEEGT